MWRYFFFKRKIFWYWGLECRTLTDRKLNWTSQYYHGAAHRELAQRQPNTSFQISNYPQPQVHKNWENIESNPFTSDYGKAENLWITFVLLNLHLALYCKNQNSIVFWYWQTFNINTFLFINWRQLIVNVWDPLSSLGAFAMVRCLRGVIEDIQKYQHSYCQPL